MNVSFQQESLGLSPVCHLSKPETDEVKVPSSTCPISNARPPRAPQFEFERANLSSSLFLLKAFGAHKGHTHATQERNHSFNQTSQQSQTSKHRYHAIQITISKSQNTKEKHRKLRFQPSNSAEMLVQSIRMCVIFANQLRQCNTVTQPSYRHQVKAEINVKTQSRTTID